MNVEEFRNRARRGLDGARLVPVWRDVLLDAETPVAAFAKHGVDARVVGEVVGAGALGGARYMEGALESIA